MFSLLFVFGILINASAHEPISSIGPNELKKYVQIEAKDKYQRSAIANLGVSIEAIRTDHVWIIANDNQINKLKQSGMRILETHDAQKYLEKQKNVFGFPEEDSRFHTYAQTQRALQDLQAKNSDISSIQSIGKTVEGRDLLALHINTNPDALITGSSNKPGALFLGNHHAREHLSLEVPLMLAQYLLGHRRDTLISKLLDSRDIWIIPMVNPDGAEYDVAAGDYRFWRKNRRENQDGTFGVDLNRNYGFQWGTGGSDSDPTSDVYMGSQPFSELETQAIRDFIEGHLNIKVLLSFHTFSELILYPWGHSYEHVPNSNDYLVFEKMAKTMAQWNHYTAEQTSDLYIASGDTTDWAYGKHGIFAFTFELSPSDMASGGFYPGAKVIDKVFGDNLLPCLYLMDAADNPYKVLEKPNSNWLNFSFDAPPPSSFLFSSYLMNGGKLLPHIN